MGSITLNEVPPNNTEQQSKFHKKNLKSVPDNEDSSQKMLVEKEDLFRSSLFPNVPPYVKFFMHDTKGKVNICLKNFLFLNYY